MPRIGFWQCMQPMAGSSPRREERETAFEVGMGVGGVTGGKRRNTSPRSGRRKTRRRQQTPGVGSRRRRVADVRSPRGMCNFRKGRAPNVADICRPAMGDACVPGVRDYGTPLAEPPTASAGFSPQFLHPKERLRMKIRIESVVSGWRDGLRGARAGVRLQTNPGGSPALACLPSQTCVRAARPIATVAGDPTDATSKVGHSHRRQSRWTRVSEAH